MKNSTLCVKITRKNEWRREREGGRGVILPIATKVINEIKVSSKVVKQKVQTKGILKIKKS